MLKRAKILARHLLRPLGVYAVARSITRQIPRIVMYHGFRPAGSIDPDFTPADVLDDQLRYLKNHFTLTTVGKLAEHYQDSGKFPRAAVALTVDDGYLDFYRYAVPVLEVYGVKATVFCATDLLTRNDWVWTDKVKYVFQAADRSSKLGYLGSILDEMRKLGPEERDAWIDRLASTAKVGIPAAPPEKYRLMGWDLLREISQSGVAEIGAHTRTHPILSTIDDGSAWEEIRGSKEDLEGELGVEVTSFCYPNGKPADYTDAQKEMVRRAGYTCGLVSHLGYATEPVDLFALPRLGTTSRDMNLFMKYLDGFEYLQRKVSRGV